MPAVHIINPMLNAYGGSEWDAVTLFDQLAPTCDVTLWAEATPDPAFLGRYPIRRIEPAHFPQNGTLVFIGTYFKIGPWVHASRPNRVILVYNVDQPDRLAQVLIGLRQLDHLPPVELVFASEYLRRETASLKGTVIHPPIDLVPFRPGPRAASPFTIGKHTRNDPAKHHPDDGPLYGRLAQQGMKVRLMGGLCLAEDAAHRNKLETQGIELLAPGAEPAAEFLRSLDAFYFRNSPELKEAWGRSVLEAMATALPVIAGPHGGYADIIQNGENGYIIDSTEEAYKTLTRLAQDPALRQKVGEKARQTALEVYGEATTNSRIDFYCRK